ncbi:hypothetical protein [Ideonella sp.]|uniref:hypothetical protein n=1 Tax=Ideonella sp. TaxID=1929293 RepID=UPI002B471B3A|nr:hypothetical protein [Ideonella sp.]HJV69979.1 hypothetical protein [Ideonella sp.]
MTHRTMTPFLRNVLRIDAALSGATALALMADAEPLAAWTGLPAAALQGIGVALVPWVGLLAWLAGRASVPGAAIGTVIALNFVWALDCALAAFGIVGSPQGLGVAVLAMQAVGTVVLAELEWVGLRRASAVVSPGVGAWAR